MLSREKKLGSRVIEELWRVEIDAEAEVLKVFPAFSCFSKGIVLNLLEFSMKSKHHMPLYGQDNKEDRPVPVS